MVYMQEKTCHQVKTPSGRPMLEDIVSDYPLHTQPYQSEGLAQQQQAMYAKDAFILPQIYEENNNIPNFGCLCTPSDNIYQGIPVGSVCELCIFAGNSV